MSELDAFETRLADAYRRYLDEAPTEADAAAVARSVVVDRSRRREITFEPFGQTIPIGVWLLVLLALLGALLGSAYLIGARHPIAPAMGCPAGSNPDVPGSPEQARPVGDFMSSAFDREAGRIIVLASLAEDTRLGAWTSGTWAFDVCTNGWADFGPAPIGADPWTQLVYADDEHITLAFTGRLGQVWAFESRSGTWARRANGTWDGPVRAAYDSDAGLVVVQPISPGRTGSAVPWTYDPARDAWRPLAGTDPLALGSTGDHLTMAYDRSFRRIVMVQETRTRLLDVTSGRWYEGAPAPLLNTGYFASGGEIAYHEADQRTVIFSDRDTAAYDGSLDRWERLFGSALPGDGTGPEARLGHTMVYDPWNERLLVVGGHFRTENGWVTGDDVLTFDVASRTWTTLLEPTGELE